MSLDLSDQELCRLRADRQGLGRPAPREGSASDYVASVAEIAAGIQAQEPRAAALAIRARSRGLVETDVGHALERDRTVVRTWLMRGTLHLVPVTDLGLLVPLLGPRFLAQSRSRLGALDWGQSALDRGVALLQRELTSGPATRSQVAALLASADLPSEGQAPIHLIRYAGLQGLVCYGPHRGTDSTFVLLRDWVDYRPLEPGDDALAELARRHLRSFGPAKPEDFAAWSGLTLTTARHAYRLLARELRERRSSRGVLWEPEGGAPRSVPSPPVRLLGRFDPLLLGYASRDLLIDNRFARRLNAGGGIIRPAVLADGHVEGIWRLETSTAHPVLGVEPFLPLSQQTLTAVCDEAEDIGRFLDRPVECAVEESN